MEKRGYYKNIGKVAAAWAIFELTVDKAIWKIAGTPQHVGACLTSQLIGPSKRFDALICLVRLFGGSKPLIDDIQSFSGRAAGLGDHRNRTLHDGWYANKEKDEIARLQITAKKELRFGLVPVKKGDLVALLVKIDKLIVDFKNLQERALAELGPSLGKPPKWPIRLD